jgi:hypothetical protein
MQLLFCIALGFACNTRQARRYYPIAPPTCAGRLSVLVFLLKEYLTTYRLFDITPHIMVFVELAAMPRVVSMKETLLRRIIFCQSK